jgi:hypothetical protein
VTRHQDRDKIAKRSRYLASGQKCTKYSEPLAKQAASVEAEFDNQRMTFGESRPSVALDDLLKRRDIIQTVVPDATTGNPNDQALINTLRDELNYGCSMAGGIDADQLIQASLCQDITYIYQHLGPRGDSETFSFQWLFSRKLEADRVNSTDSWPHLADLSLEVDDCQALPNVLIPASVRTAELRGFHRPGSATHPAIGVHTTPTHPVSRLESLKIILPSFGSEASHGMAAVAALLRTGSVPNIRSIHVEERQVDLAAAQDILNACRSHAPQIRSIRFDLSYPDEEAYNASSGQTPLLPATCLRGLPELAL